MRFFNRSLFVWRHKDVVHYQKLNGIVQFTYYTVFEDLHGWKQLYSFAIMQDNGEADARHMQARLTIDGIVTTSVDFDMPANSLHSCFQDFDGFYNFSTDKYLIMRYASFQAESIKLEMRTVSLMPSTEFFNAYVIYEERELT